MDILFHIAFLLLWVNGSRSVPRPYHGNSSISVNSTTTGRTIYHMNSTTTGRTLYHPHPRLGGSVWTSNDSRHREPPYRNQTRGSSANIVFPTEEPPEKRDIKLSPTKSCPDGATFCEKADDYPSDYVMGLLQNSAVEYKALFGRDIVDEPTLTQRIDQQENPLCESTVEVIFPKQAEDKNGNSKFIVNEKDYLQGVRIEKCMWDDESACSGFAELVPFGYQTFCKQKYIYRKMLAIDDDGSLKMVQFPLPSCCMCIVRSSSDILRSRLGLSTKLTKSKLTNQKT